MKCMSSMCGDGCPGGGSTVELCGTCDLDTGLTLYVDVTVGPYAGNTYALTYMDPGPYVDSIFGPTNLQAGWGIILGGDGTYDYFVHVQREICTLAQGAFAGNLSSTSTSVNSCSPVDIVFTGAFSAGNVYE